MNKNLSVGGFAAVNTGTIENCYSLVNISGANRQGGGFVGKNSGTITHSFCCVGRTSAAGGFVGSGGGSISQSYFFHALSKKNRMLRARFDVSLEQRWDEIHSGDDATSLGFDLDRIWEYVGGARPLRFISSKWFYDVSASPLHHQLAVAEPVIVKTAKRLREIAKRVNAGDRNAMHAYIVLDADIDLGGKEWVPIGKERARAFAGVFDGRGHTVSNFVINDKKTANKGFFGFLKGEVYNLSLDCGIKANETAGGLAAFNEGGVIGCCSAVVGISGKNANIGGLVGHNSGRVFHSFAAGRLHAGAMPWLWWLLGLNALLFSAILLLVLLRPEAPKLPVFAPVPYDQDQVPTEGEVVQPNTDSNFVSFQFEQEIDVDLATGHCAFNFKNPGNSNHNIVVQLQFTDAQAVRIMGSTGRTSEEQQALEAIPDYDPETYRTVLAESGAIRPGYELADLRLIELPNGARLPAGSYNAMVYLLFYDINTNNRAMLESQLPVQITVH